MQIVQNYNSTGVFTQPPTKDHPLDAYWTPRTATLALMTIERLPKSVADPACGSGAILDVLAEAGHVVHGADIMDYGWRPSCMVLRDYLAEPIEMNGVGIVTNPPFGRALEFVQKALSDGATYAAFLLRLNFLEAACRKAFFEANPPTRIHVSSSRITMHRHGWTGKKVSSNHAYAWFIWDRRREFKECKLRPIQI